MVIIKKKFFVFTVNEQWFAYKFRLSDLLGFTACLHVKNTPKGSFTAGKSSYTIENSLLVPEEAIFAGFKKTVQTEVKQAERMNIKCEFTNDITAFTEFYNSFAVNRKIAPVTEAKMLEMKDSLGLSFAWCNGVLLAAHSYICDKHTGIVRLMHAASRRLENPEEKQLAGRANKLLHYHDMCAFKKEGISIYDFGGYAKDTADKGLQGINSFKLSFGGIITECKNYYSYPYVIFKKTAALLKLNN